MILGVKILTLSGLALSFNLFFICQLALSLTADLLFAGDGIVLVYN